MLKHLKREYRNPVVLIGLRQYHQEINSTITWLQSMSYTSSIQSTDNVVKEAVIQLPTFTGKSFY